MDGKREDPEQCRWNDRIYRVFGGVEPPGAGGGEQRTLATTYWMDVTETEQMRQTLELTRPVLAILMVDNYEELMKACPENKRSALLAALEEQMNTWAAGTGGLLLGYDRDRYLFLFEEKELHRLCREQVRRAGSGPAGAGWRGRVRHAVHRRGTGRGQLRGSCSRTPRWRWRWPSAAAEIRPW